MLGICFFIFGENTPRAPLQEGEKGVDPSQLTHGQSITDACLGWDDTVKVLDTFAEAVRKRRGA